MNNLNEHFRLYLITVRTSFIMRYAKTGKGTEKRKVNIDKSYF